jgi:type I restriction enzyme M protein
LTSLENWLWEAACVIRGPVDAPKFKDYILPLLFLKRLSDVFDDELGGLGDIAKYADPDHSLVRFYIPENARWKNIARQTTGLGDYLTDAVRVVARDNPKLQGVIDGIDFNVTTAGQRILSDDQLRQLVQVLSRHRLGLRDVDRNDFGQAYEYLLRKFAEGQGQSAGEFLTPPEVGTLMAIILDPEPGNLVYDPTCGSARLLVKSDLRFRDKFKDASNVAPLRFFGQEINASTFAIARMDVFIYDMEAEIALSDTMNRPAFLDADGSLRRFDRVTANVMWNQKFPLATFENDTYGRFAFGIPPTSSADWGWIQHMYASLKDTGKMAVVLDTGAVSRGSGNQGSNRERDIRKAFVERDLVEAVILLPENLFYNTSAPGIILVINNVKEEGAGVVRAGSPRPNKGQILLINGSKEFEKGRPKNYLTAQNIARVTDAYLNWREGEGLSKIITTDEAARNDYNLSPSRYVARDSKEEVLPLEETLVLLSEAEEERAAVDRELDGVLGKLGFAEWRGNGRE